MQIFEYLFYNISMTSSDLQRLEYPIDRKLGLSLIKASTAARRLDVSPVTLKRWSERGILPQPVRLGIRGDRHYRLADIARLTEQTGSNDE